MLPCCEPPRCWIPASPASAAHPRAPPSAAVWPHRRGSTSTYVLARPRQTARCRVGRAAANMSSPTPPARIARPDRPHCDVGDCRGSVGDRDRHVDQHPARIVARPRLSQGGQRLAQLRGERGPVSDIGKQPRTGMRHHTLTVSGCPDLRSGRCSLHLESAPPSGRSGPSASTVSPGRGALWSIPSRHAGPVMKNRG
jgi:hypothetical protein